MSSPIYKDSEDKLQKLIDCMTDITLKLTELAVSSEQRMGTTNAMVDKMSEHTYHLAAIFEQNIECLRHQRDDLSVTNKNLTTHNAKLMEFIDNQRQDINRKDQLIESIIKAYIHKGGTNISFGDIAGTKHAE